MKKVILGIILLLSILSCTTEDTWNGSLPYTYTYCLTITGKEKGYFCSGIPVLKDETIYCINRPRAITYRLIGNDRSGLTYLYVSKDEYDKYNIGDKYCKEITVEE